MNDDELKKGSIWRKWDLHVHTPASFHWRGGKTFFEMAEKEKEASLKSLNDTISKSDVDVFCFMDYWTFDGYTAYKEYLTNKSLQETKIVFPGMELRVESPTDYRLNIHIILSNSLSSQKLSDFKSNLKIRIGKKEAALSEESLKELAQSFDDSKAKKHGFGSPSTLGDLDLYRLGSMTAEVTRESLMAAIHSMPQDTAFVFMPYDTSDGLKNLDWGKHPQADNFFMQSSDIFESRDDESIDLFLGNKTDKNKDIIDNFQKTIGSKPKPVVCGSDAHAFSEYGAFPSDKITWIKADPTWEGLKQIRIEPKDRTFVGKTPKKIEDISLNQRKYIQSININPVEEQSCPWFNQEIKLNPGLVAVIGRKGTGKSALLDIIALAGKSHVSPTNFSFLTAGRFKNKKKSFAQNYQAAISWADGTTDNFVNLDSQTDEATEEQRVKYLPQKFVENICNEDGISTAFQEQIKSVVFSYVPPAARHEAVTLDELIQTTTHGVDVNIQRLREQLGPLNEQVVALEFKGKPEYKQKLENKLAEKEKELQALKDPEPVTKPSAELDSNLQQQITDIDNQVALIEADIKTKTAELKQVIDNIAIIRKINTGIDDITTRKDKLVSDHSTEILGLGIKIEDVISLTINKKPLTEKLTQLDGSKNSLEKLLEKNNLANTESLYIKTNELSSQKSSITKNLDTKQKEYQDYLTKVKTIEAAKQVIKGVTGDKSLESITSIQEELAYLQSGLEAALKTLYNQREKLVKTLHAEILNKIHFFTEIYKPLIDFVELEKDQQLRAGSSLDFDVQVNFNKNHFTESFFAFINHSKNGTFQTKEGANKIINEIIAKYSYGQIDDVEKLQNELINCLLKDVTCNPPNDNDIERQLIDPQNGRKNIYDFLFGLSYLDVRYTIRFNGKDLNENELSPGEKGALLLIFYLLIDQDRTPLIIDQPEENLDNESVFSLLVPYIKRIKQERQVIIATHNPNLAVVCDAEQIILANKNNYSITYQSGSIENAQINTQIVNILEGTMPAFSVRRSKYYEPVI